MRSRTTQDDTSSSRQPVHHSAPSLFVLGAKLLEDPREAGALITGQTGFERLAGFGEREPLYTAILGVGLGLDVTKFRELAHRCIQRLFGYAENTEQFVHREARIAPDEIENAVMHARQTLLGQHGVGARDERVEAVEQRFEGLVELAFPLT